MRSTRIKMEVAGERGKGAMHTEPERSLLGEEVKRLSDS
jgi:hypothetical protein